MKAKVEGTRQLTAKLSKMGTDVSKYLEPAAVAGALVLQNAAKRLAPVKAGNLRRSIHIGGHEDQAPDFSSSAENRGNGRVPDPERDDERVTVYVGTDVEYAKIQEFGGTIKPKTARALVFEVNGEVVTTGAVTIPAHPYMRPAYDENIAEATEEVGLALADIIRAAAK